MKLFTKIILGIILIIALFGIGVLTGFFTGSGIKSNENITSSYGSTSIKDLPPIVRATGFFPVNATVYQNTNPLVVYQGTLEKNGSIDLQLGPIGKDRPDVTSEQESQGVSQKILESYGGIPNDAVYNGASTSYTEYYDNKSLIKKVPEFTTASYSQNINGRQVFGDSNSIILTLGSNGELLWIKKTWRNYTSDGEVQLISLDTAIDKLERQDWYETTWSPVEGHVTITSIAQAYYAQDINESAAKLEPLWVMVGPGATSLVDFHIYARQFANFTATPLVASPLEGIQFDDRSDALPTRWFWEFGDGTNSTFRNPIHVYQMSGTYNVTLTVWNDMGDDTLVKSGYITILPATNIAMDSGNTTGRR